MNYVDRLYDATPGAVIEEINGVDPDVETLLVIGHEPAMSSVALGLADARRKQHDCGRTHLDEVPDLGDRGVAHRGPWDELALSSAALVTFHVPR